MKIKILLELEEKWINYCFMFEVHILIEVNYIN